MGQRYNRKFFCLVTSVTLTNKKCKFSKCGFLRNIIVGFIVDGEKWVYLGLKKFQIKQRLTNLDKISTLYLNYL